MSELSSLLSADMTLSVALGVSPIAEAGGYILSKTGRNLDVDTATVPEDVWGGGGVYTGFPTGSAETLQVFSSDANDAAAGTGAHTVELQGLDSSFNPITEIVTLNGVTPVLTAQAFKRMHRATVLTVGSNGSNVGNITVRHSSTTANVFCVMPIGTNRSQVGGWTVPLGYRAVLLEMNVSARGGVTAEINGWLWTRTNGGPFYLTHPFTATNGAAYESADKGGFVFEEKTDIMTRITLCTNNNVEVVSTLQFLVVPTAGISLI